MELSQLDEKFSDEEFAPVDLAGVAAEVAEDLRSNAEKHGITITVDTKTAVITIPSTSIANDNISFLIFSCFNICLSYMQSLTSAPAIVSIASLFIIRSL